MFFFFFGGDFHHRPFLSSTDIQKFVFFFGAGVFRGSQLLNIVASKDSKMFFFTWFPFLNFSVPQLQGVGTFVFFLDVAFPNGCGWAMFFFQTPWWTGCDRTVDLTSFFHVKLPVPETNSKLAPWKWMVCRWFLSIFRGKFQPIFRGVGCFPFVFRECSKGNLPFELVNYCSISLKKKSLAELQFVKNPLKQWSFRKDSTK